MEATGLPDRYRNVEKLGSGGMGSVFRGFDSHLGKTVAIKVLSSQGADPESESIRRFQKEARLAGRLRHKNLVGIMDFGLTESGDPYMVMEFAEGPTLKEIVPLSLARTLALISQIVAGMSYSHRHGVVHRDLKTANIIVSRSESGEDLVKIVDFGIARSDSDEEEIKLTKTNALIGSPLYMSPEQTDGGIADERSDIYSLGCIVFECLAGNPPFRGDTAIDTIRMHREDQPPLLSGLCKEAIPEELAGLVSRMLEKNPEDRPQSMEEIAVSIGRGEPYTEPENEAEDTGERARSRLKSPLLTLAALLILVMAPGGVFFIVSNRFDSQVKSLPPVSPQDPSLMPPESERKTVTRGRERTLLLKDRIVSPEDANEIVRDKSITKLNLFKCRISDRSLENISSSPSITHLHLEKCDGFDKDGLKALSSMGRLEGLVLKDTMIPKDAFLAIGMLPQLKRLRILDEDAFDDSVAESIFPGLERIEFLDLSGTSITDSCMQQINMISGLTRLKLDNTGISNAGLRELKDSSIREIYIRETAITADEVDRLLADNSELRDVWVSGNVAAALKRRTRSNPGVRINGD